MTLRQRLADSLSFANFGGLRPLARSAPDIAAVVNPAPAQAMDDPPAMTDEERRQQQANASALATSALRSPASPRADDMPAEDPEDAPKPCPTMEELADRVAALEEKVAGNEAAAQAAATAAVVADRARGTAIMSSPEAVRSPAAALQLAFGTDLSAEDAIASLAAMTSAGTLDARMAGAEPVPPAAPSRTTSQNVAAAWDEVGEDLKSRNRSR